MNPFDPTGMTDPLLQMLLQKLTQQQPSLMAQGLEQNPQIQAIRQAGGVPLLTNQSMPYGQGQQATTEPMISSRPQDKGAFSVFGSATPDVQVTPLPQDYQENYDRNQGASEKDILESRRNRQNADAATVQAQGEFGQSLLRAGYSADDATKIAQGLMNPENMGEAEKRRQANIDAEHKRQLDEINAQKQADIEKSWLQIYTTQSGHPRPWIDPKTKKPGVDDKGMPIYETITDPTTGKLEVVKDPITPEEAAHGLAMFRLGLGGPALAQTLQQATSSQPSIKQKASANQSSIQGKKSYTPPTSAVGQIAEIAGPTIGNSLLNSTKNSLDLLPAIRLSELLLGKRFEDITPEDIAQLNPFYEILSKQKPSFRP